MTKHGNERPTALASEYEDLALAWGRAQSRAKDANRIYERMHRLAKTLRASEAGRSALLSMTQHEDRTVRLASGVNCLVFAPDVGTRVLEDLIYPRGTRSLDAEMVLREFHAGRLDLEW